MKHKEDNAQTKVFEWAAWKEKEFKLLKMLFHVPTGGYRHAREAARFKRQGVKRGIPDIFLDVPMGKFHGLRIELKIPPNRPTKEQVEYIGAYTKLGYKAIFCYNADEVIEVISQYLEIK